MKIILNNTGDLSIPGDLIIDENTIFAITENLDLITNNIVEVTNTQRPELLMSIGEDGVFIYGELTGERYKNIINLDSAGAANNYSEILEETSEYFKVLSDSPYNGIDFLLNGLLPNSKYMLSFAIEIEENITDRFNITLWDASNNSLIDEKLLDNIGLLNSKKSINVEFNTGDTIGENILLAIMQLDYNGQMIFKLFKEGLSLKLAKEEPIPEPDTSLIMHYDFKGRDNLGNYRHIIEDLSGNGNDGNLLDFKFIDGVDGYVSDGLLFSGDGNYITVQNFNPSILNNPFTFEIDFKLSKYNDSSGISSAIIGYTTSGGFPDLLISTWDADNLYFFLNNGVYNNAESLTNIPLNTRAIVAFVFDGTNIKFYLNGIKHDLKNIQSERVVYDSGILTIGGRRGLSTGYFGGTISTIKAYNKALDDSEILDSYNDML